MIKNTNISVMEHAIQVIFDMSADTALRERARLREKALHDEASALQGAKEEGLKEGIETGKNEERVAIIEKMRKIGMTEEQINAIINQ